MRQNASCLPSGNLLLSPSRSPSPLSYTLRTRLRRSEKTVPTIDRAGKQKALARSREAQQRGAHPLLPALTGFPSQTGGPTSADVSLPPGPQFYLNGDQFPPSSLISRRLQSCVICGRDTKGGKKKRERTLVPAIDVAPPSPRSPRASPRCGVRRPRTGQLRRIAVPGNNQEKIPCVACLLVDMCRLDALYVSG